MSAPVTWDGAPSRAAVVATRPTQRSEPVVVELCRGDRTVARGVALNSGGFPATEPPLAIRYCGALYIPDTERPVVGDGKGPRHVYRQVVPGSITEWVE